MKEKKDKSDKAREIVSPENEFKGYTIEEIRFQRALVAMEAEFCKSKVCHHWNNVQKLNPFSPTAKSLPGKAGSIALKIFQGLNYMDYILLGISVFSSARKVMSFFKGRKK